MATREQRLISLVQLIGGNVKAIIQKEGSLENLKTTQKLTLVAAINDLYDGLEELSSRDPTAIISDVATTGDTDVTWSADKITDYVIAASNSLKNSILDGAGAAYDTLKELQDALLSDQSIATGLADSLNNRVRFDAAQTLTSDQKIQARANIDAASAVAFNTFMAAVGDTNRDLVAVYDGVEATPILSIGQAEILNGKIGDLASLTTVSKASLVAAINEIKAGGAGASTPEVGEIKYFITPPVGNEWLPCDGQAVLRTNYPDYQAMRQSDGIVFNFDGLDNSIIIKSNSNWVLSNDNVLLQYLGNLSLSTDKLQTVSNVIMNIPSYGVAVGQLPSGRVIVVDMNTVNSYYSDDNGVTFTTVVGGGRVTIPTDSWLSVINLNDFIRVDESLVFPINGTNKLLKTVDGITWEELEAEFSGSFQKTIFENIVGCFKNKDQGAETNYFYGELGAIFEVYESGATYGVDAYITPFSFTTRNGGVISHIEVEGKGYEITSEGSSIYSIGDSGDSFSLENNRNYKNFSALMKVKNTLVGFDMTYLKHGTDFFFLSPNKLSIEKGKIFHDEKTACLLNPFTNISSAVFSDSTIVYVKAESNDGQNVMSLIITTDPLMFNTPGLVTNETAKPYVYAGTYNGVGPG